ncbi:hypothetical protein [Lutispora sp.]|uniref:hypothetical protein n=1 Tax=Lutispora sp. TaxID=2828727 RepID=UPI002B204332|nr:hypothetical protein [Lutispora sp.]MEA4963876.1 hypothetical protein [Lutispora sp.]
MSKQNNKGAIMALVLLMSSVVIAAGTALLSTSIMNYKMKRLNSRVKRTFYSAEGVLDEAYIIAFNFVESALEYACDKENFRDTYLNFITGNCEELGSDNSLVKSLKDKSNYLIYKESNMEIDAELFDKSDCMQLEVVSCCTDDKIEKKLKLICRIMIPGYDVSPGEISPEDLICIIEWKLER